MRESDQASGRDIKFRLPLIFVEAVALKPTTTLENGNAFAETLLEFCQAELALVQAVCRVNTPDVGTQRFSKKFGCKYFQINGLAQIFLT